MYYYVYRISNIIANKHYYGYRSSKTHPSKDLGIKYFSSSSDHSFIIDQKNNKNNYKYKIIKIFDNKLDAIRFESKLHYKFDVRHNDNFYNLSNQSNDSFLTQNGELYTLSHGWISCEEYKTNKEKYTLHERKLKVLDTIYNLEVIIDYDEYNSNKNRYIHASNNKVAVIDKSSNEIVYISTDEYFSNKDKFISTNKGKVAVTNLLTKETKLVSVEEFHSNINLVHPSTGSISVYDNLEKIFKSITKIEYESNRNRYSGVNKGKVSASNNPNKKIIVIYKANGEIAFTCDGNFKDICLKNNLPFSSLSKSYRNGGVPIYKNKRESSKNFIYKGWYAKVEGTA